MSDDDLDSGTRKLVDDLLSKPEGPARDEILRRARSFEYHEYRGKHATPMVVLREHLLGARFDDLASNVVDGKYDQDDEEARKWAQENGELPMTEPLLGAINMIVNSALEPVAGTPEFSHVMGALVQALGNTLGWIIAQHQDPHHIAAVVLNEIDAGVNGFMTEHRGTCRETGCDVEESCAHLRAILHDLYERALPPVAPVTPAKDAH